VERSRYEEQDPPEEVAHWKLTAEKAEELAKTLGQMKFVLQGTQGVNFWSNYSVNLIFSNFAHQKPKVAQSKSINWLVD
jgi:hypothetical protein